MSEDGFRLLSEGRVQDFNSWRMSNLTVKLDFAGKDLSVKNISGAYLKYAKLDDTAWFEQVIEKD